MTDEWLEPWLVKEEDGLWDKMPADGDEEDSDYFIDKGINKYFD